MGAPAPASAPSPLDDVPLLGEPAPVAPMPDPVPVAPEVGDGRALAGDPYASIDIMGAPPAMAPAAAMPQAGPVPEEAPVVPVSDGTPLPDDPYGQIDILGQSATTAPAAPPARGRNTAPAADLWPEPTIGRPAEPALVPEPPMQPEPMVMAAPAPEIGRASCRERV